MVSHRVKKMKIITVVVLAVSAIVGLSGLVSSFSTNFTHPDLTEEIVQLYNHHSRIKITEQEIQWMKEGSVREDEPPRWINHFYDPKDL